MEYRFVVNYTQGEQQESLEVITESPHLTLEEAEKRVEAATKPYGKTDVSNITITRSDVAENIDTDPETSASE